MSDELKKLERLRRKALAAKNAWLKAQVAYVQAETAWYKAVGLRLWEGPHRT